MSVRVRFAPSPTGYVHIGSLRTALYDFLYAKKNKGQYVLRIEDTDRTRLVEDALDNLLEAVAWAGVMHDEGPVKNEAGQMVELGEKGPYVQSNRLHIYKPYVDQLIEQGDAYYCFCSKERLDAVREENKAKGIFQAMMGIVVICRLRRQRSVLKRASLMLFDSSCLKIRKLSSMIWCVAALS